MVESSVNDLTLWSFCVRSKGCSLNVYRSIQAEKPCVTAAVGGYPDPADNYEHGPNKFVRYMMMMSTGKYEVVCLNVIVRYTMTVIHLFFKNA